MSTPLKLCKKCGNHKPLTLTYWYFNKRTQKYSSPCKDCSRALCKSWRETNKDYDKSRKSLYYQSNRDKAISRNRAYYQANKENVIEAVKKWEEKNKEYVKLLRIVKRANRAAKSYGIQDNLTTKDIELLFDKYSRCLACSVLDDLSVDHVIPLSKGGPNTLANLQVLCRRCNSGKRDKTIDYRR